MGRITEKGQKCERCGWKHGGFHICVDLSVPCPGEFNPKQPQKKRVRQGMSDVTKQRIAQAQIARWADHNVKNSKRNEEMISLYSEGEISYKGLAERFGISRTTVVKIMREAADAGVVELRPQGRRLSYD